MTQAFSGQIDGLDINTAQSAQRVIAAAVVGGTTSVISGGKFGNGAVTGAFSRALNDETEKKAKVDTDVQKEEVIKNVNIGLTKKIGKGISGKLTVDESGEISGAAKNSLGSTNVESDGAASVKPKTFYEHVKDFFSFGVTVNGSGNIEVGKSVAGVEVKVAIDPAAAGLRTDGC